MNHLFFRRFLALLINLSVIFTQVSPAVALRPTQSPTVRAGLEEALRDAPAQNPIWAGTRLQLISQILANRNLRNGDFSTSLHETVWDWMTQVATLAPGLAQVLPPREEVDQALSELTSQAPTGICVTCGTHAVANVVFSHPQRHLPEISQSSSFNQQEQLTALLVFLDLLNHNRVLSLEGTDGHRRLANSMQSVKDALEILGGSTQPWNGVRLLDTELTDLVNRDSLVIAHVGSNHFVRILGISDGQVAYSEPTPGDPEGIQTKPTSEFFRWWRSRLGRGIVLTNHDFGASRSVLTETELSRVIGCCGINVMFGQFGGVRAILDAVLRLKYRAPDNTGIALFSEDGISVRKVQGAPEDLILDAYQRPIYPETFPRLFEYAPDRGYQPNPDHLSDIDRAIREGKKNWSRSRQTTDPDERKRLRTEAAGHFSEARRIERDHLLNSAVYQAMIQRFDLLAEEGLNEFVPTAEQISVGRGWPVDLTHPKTKREDVFGAKVSIQIGRMGGLWAGDQFLIRHDNVPELVQEIVRLFELTPEFVRLFLRAELIHSMEEQQVPADRIRQLLLRYDLLFNRVLAKRLEEQDQDQWEEILDFLVGRWLWVPPDYNVDVVRHVFRAQGGLIGIFQTDPEWRKEVETLFEKRMSRHGQEWLHYWKRERDLNLPGHAFAALTDWFHRWASQQKIDLVTISSEGGQAFEQVPLMPEAVYQRLERIRQEQIGIFVQNPKNPDRGRYRRGYGLGTVNEYTVRLMGELIVGHGRWAMTGDPSRWNAHPHDTPMRVMVHNGAVKGETGDHLRSEHAKASREAGFEWYANAYKADEQLEGQAVTVPIQADTRTIVVHWDFVAKQFEMDAAQGRIHEDGLTIPLDAPGFLNQDRHGFNRAKAWNQVLENLHRQGRQEINPDEIACRVAALEMQDGSELGVHASSLESPLTTYVISHDRPVDIVTLGDQVLVTSDYAAGIALFPAPEVAQAAERLSVLQQELQTDLEDLKRRRKLPSSHEDHLSEAEYEEEVKRRLHQFKEDEDEITKPYKVKVLHLTELNKFARITRRLAEDGSVQVDVDISHLDGTPLRKTERKLEAKEKMRGVSPHQGVKGFYRTFMELHIDEIPKILLDDAVSYMTIERGRATGVHIPTLQVDRLRERFGENLQGLKRIFLVGVGSSWRDALIAKQLFQDLLPGTTLIFDPVEIQNLGIGINLDSDLAIGLSWSGTTASMVKLFHRLSKAGVMVMSVTGKTGSNMADLGMESAGMIDVKSGPEASVATTKGFESVLYCLSLVGIQLSQMQNRPELAQERAAYVNDLWRVVDLVYDQIFEPNKKGVERVLDIDDPQSTVNRLAAAWKKRQKVLIVGSRNNQVSLEAELKAEEIAWLVGKANDISDESWRNVIRVNENGRVPEAERVACIFNMTDPERLDEFIDAIRDLASRNIQVAVQTFQEGNPYFEELQRLHGENRIELVVVPRVRLSLQALVDAPFFFRFALALARARGLTDSQIDNSRNLAKSVTVSGARSLQEMIRSASGRYITAREQASKVQAFQTAFELYRERLPRVLGVLQNSREQSIARLPVLLDSRLNRWLGPEGILMQQTDRAKAVELLKDFKEAAVAHVPSARAVIVTDEEATEYAAYAAVGPYGSREVVVSGEHSDLYKPEKGLRIRFGSWYYRASYDREDKFYTIRYDAQDNPYAQGKLPPITEPFQIHEGQETVEVNGRSYKVDPSSFLSDPDDAEKLLSGLQLTALQPDLLLQGTENVTIFRSVDKAIETSIQEGTLVILISRGRNRGARNAQIEPTRSYRARSGEQIPRHPDEQSEDRMMALANRFQVRGVPVVTISDDISRLREPSLDSNRVAHVSVGADLDDVSVYPLTYLALLTIGARIGELIGRDNTDFQTSLRTIPGLVAGFLMDDATRKRAQRLFQFVRQYRKIHIIGGGQAYADAKEWARQLSMLGILGEAQLNDSAWHGPLAGVDPNKLKFAVANTPGYLRKYGINAAYPLDDDTLVFFLGTDSKFSDSSVTDMQVYDSRNSRSAVVVPESHVQKLGPDGKPNPLRSTLIRAGAVKLNSITEEQVDHPELQDPEGIFGVPDAPDFLGNFNVAAFGALAAWTFSQNHQQALKAERGEPPSRILPPGVSVPPALPPVGVGVPLEVSGIRARLEQELKGRSPEEIEALINAYFALKEMTGKKQKPILIEELVDDGLEMTVTVAAVLRKLPKGKPEINIALSSGIPQVTAQQGREIPPQRLFVRGFHETPDSPEVALIRITFDREEALDPKINLTRAIEKTLDPYLLFEEEAVDLATPLPSVLRPHRELVLEMLQQFQEEPSIRFEHRPGPEPSQTLLLAVGGQRVPGILEAFGWPLADWNVTPGVYRSDHVEFAYFLVDASEEKLAQAGVFAAIQERLNALIIPTDFKTQLSQANPTFKQEDFEIFFSVFQAVQKGRGLEVAVSPDPYRGNEQSLITIALEDFPEGEPRHDQVKQLVERHIFAEGRKVMGEPLDIVYRGIRLLQYTVDNSAESTSVRGAAGLIKPTLQQLISGGGEISEDVQEEQIRLRSEFKDALSLRVLSLVIQAYQALKTPSAPPQVLAAKDLSDPEHRSIVVVAESPDHLGIMASITGVFAEGRINLGEDVSRPFQEARIVVFEVFAPLSTTEELLPQIRDKILSFRDQNPSQAEEAFGQFLKAGRLDDHENWFKTLFRKQEETPQVSVEIRQPSGSVHSYVAALAPLNRSDRVPALKDSLYQAIQKKVQEQRAVEEESAVGRMVIERYEPPGESKPLAAILIVLNLDVSQALEMKLDQLVQKLVTQNLMTGLEEQFLTWPEEIAATDPVAAIQTALQTSNFVRRIRQIREGRRGRVQVQTRFLEDLELEQLRNQGNVLMDLGSIAVNVKLGDVEVKETLSLIHNSRFYGPVEIEGPIRGRIVALASGLQVRQGIRNATFYGTVRLGSDVTVEDAVVQNYAIKDRAVVRRAELVVDGPTEFGLGKPMALRNEAGLRPVLAYPEMRLEEAVKLSSRRDDRKLQADYQAAHDAYVKTILSPLGVIEEGAIVDGVGRIVNGYVGKGAILDGAEQLQNIVVMSGFTPQEAEELDRLLQGTQEAGVLLRGLDAERIRRLQQEFPNPEALKAHLVEGERTRIGHGVVVEGGILQPGVHVNSGAHLPRVFMAEHSKAQERVHLSDSMVGPDSVLAKGEFGSVLAESSVVSHHKGTLHLASRLRSGINIGSGGQTSNHAGLGPVLESVLGVGTFLGTNVTIQYPVDFEGSPHSLIQTNVLVPSHQIVSMPFMLMGHPSQDALAHLGPKARLHNEVSPAWVLQHLLYMVLRNEGKWKERQTSLRYRFNHEIFQPETVDQMIEARKALRSVPGGSLDLLYTGKEIPGLGNNYLREEARLQADGTYTRFIQYYALRELYRQMDRLSKSGHIQDVGGLLSESSGNRKWEQARTILTQEFPGMTLQQALQRFASEQIRLYGEVSAAPLRQYQRFQQIIGDASGVLPDPQQDKFVLSFGGETEQIQARVKELVAQLQTQAGLEEWVRPETSGLEESGKILTGHKGPVISVAFSRDRKIPLLASASQDGTIRIWDSRSGALKRMIQNWATEGEATVRRPYLPHPNVLTLTFSSNGKAVLSVGAQSVLRREAHHGIQVGALEFEVPLPSGPSVYSGSFAFHPNRRSILVGGRVDEAVIQNLEPQDKERFVSTQGIIKKLKPVSGGQPLSVAFHPEGTQVVLGTDRGTIEWWETGEPTSSTAKHLETFPEAHPNAEVLAVLFDSQGELLVSADNQGYVRLFDFEMGQTRWVQHYAQTPVTALAFTSGEQILAYAGQDGVIRFLDVGTGILRGTISSLKDTPILSLAFSPDGKKIAAGRTDGTIAFMNVPDLVGLEETPSEPGLATRRVIFLGPEMAVPVIRLLGKIQTALELVIFARDAERVSEINISLAVQKTANPNFPKWHVVNLDRDYSGNLQMALLVWQDKLDSADVSIYPVMTPKDLRGLGPFLDISEDISFRSLLEQMGLKEIAPSA